MAANASFGPHTGWMNPLSTASWRPSNNLEARLMAYIAISFCTSITQPSGTTSLGSLRSDKAACATISKQFGFDYFDGDRKYGYGGFRYDGRWVPVAQDMVKHYALKSGARILDIGCAKGFLVHDRMKVLPGVMLLGSTSRIMPLPTPCRRL